MKLRPHKILFSVKPWKLSPAKINDTTVFDSEILKFSSFINCITLITTLCITLMIALHPTTCISNQGAFQLAINDCPCLFQLLAFLKCSCTIMFKLSVQKIACHKKLLTQQKCFMNLCWNKFLVSTAVFMKNIRFRMDLYL